MPDTLSARALECIDACAGWENPHEMRRCAEAFLKLAGDMVGPSYELAYPKVDQEEDDDD